MRLVDLFEHTAAATPAACALVDCSVDPAATVTYAALMAQSILVRDAVNTVSLVGICCPPSAAAIAAIIGVMLSDRPYLPLLVDDVRAGCAALPPDLQLIIVAPSVPRSSAMEVVLDLSSSSLPLELVRARAVEPRPLASTRFAYYIRTSGTVSGSGSLVRVTHQCIVSNILGLQRRLSASHADVFVLVSAFTFDPSVVELFVAFSVGACIVIVDETTKRTPLALSQVLIAHCVTVLMCTPSLFRRFPVDTLRGPLLGVDSRLKSVVLGGEACLSASMLLDAWPASSRTRIFNIYGITEMSSWASLSEIHRSTLHEASAVCIGEPLDETTLRVLDESKAEVHNGVGELHLFSETRLCVVDGEDSPVHQRFTGDMVEIHTHQSGQRDIRWLHRQGSVVKHQGQFVNLELLAQTVARVLSLQAVLFRLCPSKSTVFSLVCGNIRLSSFIVLEVQRTVAQFHPTHCIPRDVVIVETMPLNTNGKVDGPALDAVYATKSCPQSPLARYTQATLWQQLTTLSTQLLGEDWDESKTLLENGGDSTVAVLFIERAKACSQRIRSASPALIDSIFRLPMGQFLRHVCDIEFSQGEEMQDTSLIAKRPKLSQKVEVHQEVTPVQRMCCWSRKFLGPFNADGALCSEHRVESTMEATDVSMKIKWKYNLGKCIDASPLIVTYRLADQPAQSYVYIGSHSHNMCCLQWHSGAPQWTAVLPDRIESSAAVSRCGRYVIVGCYDAALYFLRAHDGSVFDTVRTGDAIKCSPCVDSADGMVYCGSHDGSLYAIEINASGVGVRWSLSVAAAVSKSAVSSAIFASPAISPGGEHVVCVTLSGMIVSCKTQCDRPEIRWSTALPGAVFSTPTFLGRSSRFAIGCTNGSMYVISEGLIEYSLAVGAPIFAQPALFVSDRQSYIAFGSHAKTLTIVDSDAGLLLQSLPLDSDVTSTVGTVPLADGSALVVCPSVDGRIAVVHHGAVCQQLQLPGQVFSSPTCMGSSFVVGCRDDHLYRIDLA